MEQSETHKLGEWERQKGAMIIGDNVDVEQEMTGDEFDQLMTDSHYLGVDYKGRTEWLEANGYELTRENYMNTELKSIPLDDEEIEE